MLIVCTSFFSFRSGGGGVAGVGDGASDPLLSVILDEVMDIVPESYNQENSELMNLINAMDSQTGQQSPNNHHHNTYQVIHIILITYLFY